MERQRGLAGGFRPVDLDDAPPGDAADAQRHIQRKRPGGNSLHLHGRVFAQTHHRTLAELLLQLLQRGFQSFLFVHFQAPLLS